MMPVRMTVNWIDGSAHVYPAVWLRDNIPSGRHRAEGQRVFDINTLPAGMEISDAVLEAEGVRVSFSPEAFSDVFPV